MTKATKATQATQATGRGGASVNSSGPPSRFWLIILGALFAASLEPVLAKIGYRTNLDPWQLIFVKNSVGLLTILPLVYAVRRWRHEAPPTPVTSGQRVQMVGVSLLLFVTGTCMLWAVKTLPAVTVITLVTTTPAFVALVNQRRGIDKLSRKFWAGFCLCFLGVLLSTGAFLQELSGDLKGLILVALSIVSSTVYRTQLEDLTSKVSPLTVSTFIFIFNALISWTLILPVMRWPDSTGWMIGSWVGLAAALANVGFLFAIHLVGSTNMSVFNLLQRPLVVVVAALVLGEKMAIFQWFGVALVLLGVRFAQVPRPSPR